MKNELSDPFFAQKLDDQGNYGRESFMHKMYDNQEQRRHKKPTSLYDYQKIQSTLHGSQFLGQRHYMLGGPTSGHDQNLVQRVHHDKKFKRSSPSPDRIFDNVRGASVPINSYNCISQFMPGNKEAPRRTILQNF